MIKILFANIQSNLAIVKSANRLWGNPLEGYSTHELLYREMVVMGLKFISRGESPRNITDQLVANLPPKIQAKLEAEAA